jgi:hypothetical protein
MANLLEIEPSKHIYDPVRLDYQDMEGALITAYKDKL